MKTVMQQAIIKLMEQPNEMCSQKSIADWLEACYLQSEKIQIIETHIACVKAGTERESKRKMTKADEKIVRQDIENYYNETYLK